jgi:hypothetical protein
VLVQRFRKCGPKHTDTCVNNINSESKGGHLGENEERKGPQHELRGTIPEDPKTEQHEDCNDQCGFDWANDLSLQLLAAMDAIPMNTAIANHALQLIAMHQIVKDIKS